MRIVTILMIIFSATSCSSLKKSLIYSSLAGSITGIVAGAAFSPNRESRRANAALFGAIGGGVAALTGYALYKDDPRNYKLKHMMTPLPGISEPNNNEFEINLGNLKIDAKLEKNEAYEVPLKSLPQKLKGKVNKQFLIKYQSKERYIKKGHKTYYIPSFEVYEHAYGESLNFTNGGDL